MSRTCPHTRTPENTRRYSDGRLRCLECKRAWDNAHTRRKRSRRAEERIPSLRFEYLPFEPMAKWAPRPFHEFSAEGGKGGLHSFPMRYQRAWHRAQSEGRITVGMADELCIHVLHMHPSEVYGTLWFEDVSA